MNMKIELIPDLINTVDWKKYSAAEWVEQYGAWVNCDMASRSIGSSSTPLASLMDSANKHRSGRKKPPLPLMKISDDEARAVSRILNEMLEKRDIEVSQWAWVLILKYEGRWEWPSIAGSMNWTVHKTREAEKQGFAFFKGRILSK